VRYEIDVEDMILGALEALSRSSGITRGRRWTMTIKFLKISDCDSWPELAESRVAFLVLLVR
jgi:hypothetical protein